MNKTSIEWTDYTWNPIRANLKGPHGPRPHSGTFCTRISPGCTHCYASLINRRFGNGLDYTVPNLERVKFFIDEKILAQPLKLRKPSRIFVGDMFDLFHESIPDPLIDLVVSVAVDADWHTLQFLTKRAHRMQRYFQELSAERLRVASANRPPDGNLHPWPFRNFWLGVSVEDQQRADERIPLLLQTPAAVRFLSVEPQLEEIDIRKYLATGLIHLVIDGGESGLGARPFNLAWAESLLAQCRDAGVPFFMKQTGGNLFCQDCADQNTHFCGHYKPKDRKGGDPSGWPEHIRVREFPALKSTFEAEMMRCSQ